MRKYHQKLILELVESLREANREVKTLSQANEIGSMINLLADCQESAEQIVSFIKTLDIGGAKTISLLEEYGKLLYLVSIETENSKHLIKELQRQLVKIENSVKTELKPNKLEMVFFPYKASMWDCMESVWLAAKDDPDCDAYVVPIPSYEINPDGTLGKMYYDGDQYPDSIPITDWQKYDVEARQPDVVFTHYAYDDNVKNASIHPVFYSQRLRKHCRRLIHIPYFVVAGEPVEEYYCSLPGVLYAHHVMVESETVRQSFIDHYKKYDKEYGWNGCFGKAEEKFMALGSPKFDKVLNSKPEDFELPPEWQALILKPDGSRKKIVLYNTHMFQWIKGGEQYFKKMRSVFDVFRNRDDVVLWWRPHPNTELNFRILCPQLLDEYYAVLDEYRCGGREIYVDTPDLSRAAAASEAK